MDDEQDELPDFLPSTSKNINTKEYKALPQNQFPSNCCVCQYPSTGYHYGVASCNGCKSFFRRTVINGMNYSCLKTQNCFDTNHINKNHRLNCRACRFQKCVDVGMHPSAIQYNMSDLAKKFIAEIWLEVKNEPSSASPSPKLMFPDEVVNQTICRLSTVESVSSKIHDSGLPSGFYDLRTLEEILTSNMVARNSDIPNLEKNTMDERYNHPRVYAHCSFLSSVEYSKTFEFYSKTTTSDKIRLIRHVIVACAALHDAFFSINHMKSDCLVFPNGTKFGEKKDGCIGFFERTISVMLRNKLNRVEYMLLKAIVLCNPAVCSLSKHAQQLLERERRQYGFCLLRYCRLQYGVMNGANRYSELLAIIPIVENQVKLLKDLHVLATMMAYQNGKTFSCSNLFTQVLE